MTDSPPGISAALTDGAARYKSFVLSDHDERGRAISESDPDTPRALADAVDRLYDEINAVLDRFDATRHPMPADQEQLETDCMYSPRRVPRRAWSLTTGRGCGSLTMREVWTVDEIARLEVQPDRQPTGRPMASPGNPVVSCDAPTDDLVWSAIGPR
jgi:hypothetical protein